MYRTVSIPLSHPFLRIVSCFSVALLWWDPVLTVAPLAPPRESQLPESPLHQLPLTEDDLWNFSNCHAPGFQLSPS